MNFLLRRVAFFGYADLLLHDPQNATTLESSRAENCAEPVRALHKARGQVMCKTSKMRCCLALILVRCPLLCPSWK